MTEKEVYLIETLKTLVPITLKDQYKSAFAHRVVKRFLSFTFLAFFLQYLLVYHLPITYPALPLYPPIGAAFVMIYWLGNLACIGLILGGVCAYYLGGVSIEASGLYVFADVMCAAWGVWVCRAVFDSDHALFTQPKAWLLLIKKNALTTCFFSSCLRMVAVYWHTSGQLNVQQGFYDWINFWLSDLNAVFIFAGFFFPWLSIYIGRGSIALSPVKRLCIVVAVLYLLTLIFLAYFSGCQQICLMVCGLSLYTMITLILGLVWIGVLYVLCSMASCEGIMTKP